MHYGYETLEYCQGGAYALSFEMLARMAQQGYFADPMIWVGLPVAEDVMIGMYTRAVGLKVIDFSDAGEPFGVQHQGLAYSPPEMASKAYAVIHSVKNDPYCSEMEIREYFWRRRMVAQTAAENRSADHGQ